MKINDIYKVYVHWSESEYINKVLGCDENSDINKEIDSVEFNKIIKKAAPLVGQGYDKTVMTLHIKDSGLYVELKCNLTPARNSLVKLIKDFI